MVAASLDDQLDAITEHALAGDIEGAVLELRAVLRAVPDSGPAWLTLATILSSAARWGESSEAFARAVALGAATAATYRTWSRALEHLDRLDQAADALRRAHGLAPTDPAPLR